MKRVLMTVFGIFVFSLSGFCWPIIEIDGIYYKILPNNDCDVLVLGYGENFEQRDKFVIPSHIGDDYPIVNIISEYAFSGCDLFNTLVISEGVTTIEECAFAGPNSLHKLYLPSTLQEVGKYAFWFAWFESPGHYEGIDEIYIRATTPPRCAAYYSDRSSSFGPLCHKLYVPIGCGEAYRNAPDWKEHNVIEYDFADVNGDGNVNGSDVTALYNELLGGVEAAGVSDVNGDGNVNGADVTALYTRLLNEE